ncbi:MAG: class II aldolase/adducin family protein [Gammaproteobacteria bacterium]
MTHEQEGVVKFRSTHTFESISFPEQSLTRLNAWRTLLHRLTLIGRFPDRYGGLGFGNISLRHGRADGFIISGTQTGHLACLTRDHYCQVLEADLPTNRILSTGPCRPSSEALTHASVYRQDNKIQCVIHTHCPEIWIHARRLGLAHTDREIAYGTPEMASAVADLFQAGRLSRKGIFTMAGHEDGVVSFGETIELAARETIEKLASAIAIEQRGTFV